MDFKFFSYENYFIFIFGVITLIFAIISIIFIGNVTGSVIGENKMYIIAFFSFLYLF